MLVAHGSAGVGKIYIYNNIQVHDNTHNSTNYTIIILLLLLLIIIIIIFMLVAHRSAGVGKIYVLTTINTICIKHRNIEL